MKEIGLIYLSWRQGFGKRRYIVGVIRKNANEGIRFEYLKQDVQAAQKDGFTPYVEFPEIDRTYKDNVLEIFGQRIIKSERSDISDFLDFWEIDPKYKDDKFYFLAHTQGLNPSDNFEFLAEYNPTRSLRFLTDLASLSVLNLQPDTLKAGDILSYCLEPDNEYDPYAVKVFKGSQHVGYVKKVHNRVFYKIHRNHFTLKVKAVEQNGIVKRVFVSVLAY